MLSPEICNFKAPDSLLKIEKHTSNSCLQTIQKLPHNHLVSVVLPNVLRTPTTVCDLIKTNCEYYKVIDLSPEELTNVRFIENFVKKGAFSAISVNTNIDTDDCFCALADGLMILSLRKETYESFGVEGVVSNFYCKSKERYIVHINLLSNTLKSTSKRYEKTRERLSRLGKVSMLINWEPPQDDICPSSIAKYFSDLSYNVKLCVPDLNVRTSYSVKVPKLDDVSEFVEWLGMFSLETDSENSDDYLTTYETPTPHQEYGQVKFLQARGFFSCAQLQKLTEILMTIAKTEDVPWLTLYVQGFSDSVIGWNTQEHHYYTNGDNSYVIVMNSENYRIARFSCSRKCYKQ